MTDTFHREYVVRLPLPLAQLYTRAFNDKSPRSRHDCAYYTFEALLKLGVATLTTGYINDRRGGRARVPAVDGAISALRRPAEGHWLAILREASRDFGRRVDAATHPLGHFWKQLNANHSDPELVQLLRRLKRGFHTDEKTSQRPSELPTVCSLYDLFEALVGYRNSVIGHGGAPRFNQFYEAEMGPLLLPAVNWVLGPGVFDPLGPKGSVLLFLRELAKTGDGFEATFCDLMGNPPVQLPKRAFKGPEVGGWHAGDLFVQWAANPDQPLRLTPLLVGTEDDANGIRVLFLNGNKKNEVEYVSYDGGSSRRGPSTALDLAAMLSLVEEKPVSPGEIPTAPEVDDYTIESKLGEGGMGVVYLARHNSLGLRHALKMLPAQSAADALTVSRFNREIRALMTCNHPNVVKFLSFGRMRSGVYYAMEYVNGCTLEDVHRSLTDPANAAETATGQTWDTAVTRASTRAALTEAPREAPAPKPAATVPPAGANPAPVEREYVRRVTKVMRDAALALAEVHRQNIVHRDVKPGNLMIEARSGRVVLVDFGLAKGTRIVTDVTTKDNDAPGTLRYMAPEQLAAQSGRTGLKPELADIRAVGVTLWELLTRKRLFAEAENPEQLRACIREREVPLLSQHDRSFAAYPDLEAVVYRATERDPARRIPSAQNLAEYLDCVLTGRPLPTAVRVPGVRERLGRWVQANRMVVGTTGMCLALVVALILLFVFQAPPPVPVPPSEDPEKIAQQQLKELRERERRLSARATQLLDEGDLPNALLYLGEAASLPIQDPERERWLALRFNLTLNESPRLKPFVLDAGGKITAHGFGPSGDKLAVGREDGTLLCWETVSGKPSFVGGPKHEQAIRFVAFSPNGKVIATASDDRTAKLWDAATGRLLYTLEHKYPLTHVTFDPSGEFVATASGEIASKQLASERAPKLVERPVEESEIVDGVEKKVTKKRLVTLYDWVMMDVMLRDRPPGNQEEPRDAGEARVWNVATGRLAAKILSHDYTLAKCMFTPDGRGLITCRPPADQVKPGYLISGPAVSSWPAMNAMPGISDKNLPAEKKMPGISDKDDGRYRGGPVQVWNWRAGARRDVKFAEGQFLLNAQLGRVGGLWVTSLSSENPNQLVQEFCDTTRDYVVRKRSEPVPGDAAWFRCWSGDPDDSNVRAVLVRDNVLSVLKAPFPNAWATPFDAANWRERLQEIKGTHTLEQAPNHLAVDDRGNQLFAATGTALTAYDLFDKTYRVRRLALPGSVSGLDASAADSVYVETASRFVCLLQPGGTSSRWGADDRVACRTRDVDFDVMNESGTAGVERDRMTDRFSVWHLGADGRVTRHGFTPPLVRKKDALPLNAGGFDQTAVARNGNRLIALWGGTVFRVDCRTGAAAAWADQPDGCALLFADADGGRAVTVSRRGETLLVEPRDAATGRPLGAGSFTADRQKSVHVFQNATRAAVFAPTGAVEVRDLDRGGVVHTIPVPAAGTRAPATVTEAGLAASFGTTPEERDRPVILWDLAAGTRLEAAGRRITHPGVGTLTVLFASPTHLVTTAYHDPDVRNTFDQKTTLRVWDARTGEPVGPAVTIPKTYQQVKVSPDGRSLAGVFTPSVWGEVPRLRIWSLPDGEPLMPWRELEGWPLNFAFSADSAELRIVFAQHLPAQRYPLRPEAVDRRLLQALGRLGAHAGLDGGDAPQRLPADELAKQADWVRRQPGGVPDPEAGVDYHRVMAGDCEADLLWQRALVHWEAVLGASPNDADARRGRARALAELGRWPESAGAWKLLVDANGLKDEDLAAAAVAFFQAGQRLEGEKLFKSGLKQARTPQAVKEYLLILIAESMTTDEKPIRARDYLSSVPELEDLNYELFRLSYRNFEITETDRRVKTSRGEKEDPTEIRKGYQLSVDNLKQIRRGGTYYETPEYYFLLALAHHGLGRTADARTALDRAERSYNRALMTSDRLGPSTGLPLRVPTTYVHWIYLEKLRAEARGRILGKELK